MRSKILSFLIPSRNRLDMLIKTINNIIDSFSDNINDIEIIIKLDLDDLESHKILCEKFDVDVKYIISDRLKGYLSLSDFMSQCYKLSDGYFFLMYNDDITVKNHYNLIENLKENKDIISISSESMTSQLPILHYKIIEITNGFHSDVVFWDGHFCNVKLSLPIENQLNFKFEYDHDNDSRKFPNLYNERNEFIKNYSFDESLGCHGERYYVDLDSKTIKQYFNKI
jgi:hypothetical protein